jgi:hypothetical protein
MKIAIGSDERTHLTDVLIEDLRPRGHTVEAFGPLAAPGADPEEDWPLVSARVAQTVASGEADEGIVCCWTGTGASIAANKVAGVRPAPVPDGNGKGGYEHNGARRKAGLNTSIHDAGLRHFLSILTCKAACAGKRVEVVSPAYTTQDCSGCGKRIHKSLSVRTHVCTNCGLILDRDLNAARNIQ